MTLDIRITEKTTKLVTVEPQDVGRTIMQYVGQLLHGIDDAGCDWYTFAENTYIGGADWCISDDPNIVALVDAANILRYRKLFRLTAEDINRQFEHEAELGV